MANNLQNTTQNTKGQTTQWPRRTDNTMAKKNRQHNGQEEQTTQWPKEKDKQTTIYKSCT